MSVTDFASLDFGSPEDYDSEKKNKTESEKIISLFRRFRNIKEKVS